MTARPLRPDARARTASRRMGWRVANVHIGWWLGSARRTPANASRGPESAPASGLSRLVAAGVMGGRTGFQRSRATAWAHCYAVPVAFLLATLMAGAPVHSLPPVAQAAPYIAPAATLESLLATGASEAGSSSDVPDAPLAGSEAAARYAAEPHDDADATSPEAASALTRSDLLDALAASPWPSHLWEAVVDIAYCESRFDALAVGDQGQSFGLMQVHAPAHPRLVRSFDLLDARDNLAAAYVVYLEAGGSFRPWSCWQ